MSFPLQAQYVVQGVVTDSLTREPLPYTSVYLKGTTEGGMTDDKGQFSFKTYRPQAVLVISAIGYNEYTRLIHPAQGIRLTIALSPATYALNEVVVKPKRERYKKKDNPAVEFVRQMIEHRDDYSPKELDFWQRDRYEKMTFAINNFDSVKQQKWLYRKFKFLTDYVDTSAVTGKPCLPSPTVSCWLRTITANLPKARNSAYMLANRPAWMRCFRSKAWSKPSV